VIPERSEDSRPETLRSAQGDGGPGGPPPCHAERSEASRPEPPHAGHELIRLGPRALLVALLVVAATYLGIIRLGFIRICWVPYVIPPVPALLFLLLLQGLNVVLHRLQRYGSLPTWLRPFSRGELFLIYGAAAISLSMDRGGYILHYLMTPAYYGTEVDRWPELFTHYPSYYIPHDPRLIAEWFEGNPTGAVPWAAWWRPLLWWSCFNFTLVFALLCLVAIFRRQWVEEERLTFPLLFLPLEVTGGLHPESVARGFFRNPIMWIGFSLAAFHNGLNILHAFVPRIPAPTWYYSLDPHLAEAPWVHLRPLYLFFGLEIWGLAYLASGEVLLSGWFFYFLMKLIKLVGREAGYLGAGFPHFQEVSGGACIAVAGFMLAVARPHLRRVLWAALGRAHGEERDEALPGKWLVYAAVLGTTVLIVMLTAAGQSPLLLIIYFATLYMYVLVAARVRAEVGIPVAWNVPYGFETQTPVDLLGTRQVLRMGGERGTVLYYALFWIGRTIFAHSAAQYGIDHLRLADHGRVRRQSMLGIMLVGALAGMALTWWYHLDVGYRYGQGLIGAKAGQAGWAWAFSWSRGQYSLLRAALDRPRGPEPTILAAYGSGFAFAVLLTVLRSRFWAFPFHPVGFILATLYGDYTPYWFPFLVAWLGQRIALRYGGLPLYRKLVPGFIGLAFGHIVIGGILWRIVINYLIDPTISARYYLNLGG